MNRDVSTRPLARPFARSLAPLTRSLAPDCSLRSRPPLRSLVRSLAHFAHSLAHGTVNDWMAIFSVFFAIFDHSDTRILPLSNSRVVTSATSVRLTSKCTPITIAKTLPSCAKAFNGFAPRKIAALWLAIITSKEPRISIACDQDATFTSRTKLIWVGRGVQTNKLKG